MEPTDAQDAALTGTVLGEAYRLTRLCGRGGMGAVYEGQHLRLNKRVAVKLMARELAANTEAMARFRREAEVTSQLGHPHIVQVFDFGLAATGEPYLVMEFLEGEDLDQRLRRVGRLSLAAATNIIKQVASALAATHGKGIVHRDLKPANIFLLSIDDADFVKVVDFGISKVRTATTKLTAAAVVMGTPNYMSPEQATGRVDEIDHRTDQWALGCIAYELLVGRPPFVGENVASLLYQVVHQAPSPLTQNAPEVPAALDQVLGCALAKRQEDRFASMTAFARAFEGAATGRPLTGLPVATPVAAAPEAAVSAPTEMAVATAPPRAPVAIGVQPTTFSTAASEAVAAEVPARGRAGARWAVVVVVAAVFLIGAGLLAMRGRAPAPPVAASASAPRSAPLPSPAPASPTAAVRAVERSAPPPQATPAPTAAAPPKKDRGKRGKARAAIATPPAAAPAGEPASPAAVAPAAVPPTQPEPPAPAWPPPGATAAEPVYRPAWPPPPTGPDGAPAAKPKKKGLFRRIFRHDD